jgi:hypothetical protein
MHPLGQPEPQVAQILPLGHCLQQRFWPEEFVSQKPSVQASARVVGTNLSMTLLPRRPMDWSMAFSFVVVVRTPNGATDRRSVRLSTAAEQHL